MKMLTSRLALELLLALTQRRDGARLGELADAVAAPLSSAQRAVHLLMSDRLAERARGTRPRYRLDLRHPALPSLRELALVSLPADRVLDALVGANPAIEFAGKDGRGYLIVGAPDAEPADLLLLEDALSDLARLGRPAAVTWLTHHEAVRGVGEDRGLHSRIAGLAMLKGKVARSFPEPGATAQPRGATPRRPVRTRPAPLSVSRRAIAEVARRHGLRRVRLFGSAARGELGARSDVDVLIEPRSDAPLSLIDLGRIEAQLEPIFDRHVDLITPGGLRPEVRDVAQREAVTLYG